jgi:anti-sigma regulatory factor (Ser/Thr protein kinase)
MAMLRVSGAPDMRIGLENRPENVALVRQALGGVGAAVRVNGSLLADIKTAVSEACNNVVVHAYRGGPGLMEIYAFPEGRELTVVVRDQGQGIQPRPPEPDAAMLGVGLSLIQALTKRVEFGGSVEEGTEVRMTFEAADDLDLGVEAVSEEGAEPSQAPQGDVELSVCGLLTGPVLSSVVAMVAARSGFSVERLSDAQILADTIAAHAPASFVGRHVHLAIDAREAELHLRLGPLVSGGGQMLVSASGVGGLEPLLERLSDELTVESRDGGEQLVMSLREPR